MMAVESRRSSGPPMKATHFYLSTLKEAPADAEIVSHRLMSRAGLIKRLAAGVYTYMPLGIRVLRRIEGIIRDEMNRAGAVELLMPVVQPAELWQESGRWVQYGPELLRIKDRHERDFVLQPTSEEVITDIARQELKSYRQLPRNFYHIQTKFRDERRPRFGVMRGREFTMKDAYSFDRDPEAALASYQRMYEAYGAIFTRMGLKFRAVAADTGSIGGSASHEFQVIADTGEDALAYSEGSDYAANIELAEAVALIPTRAEAREALVLTPTPGKARCEDVAALLGLPLERTVKSLVLAVDERGPADKARPDEPGPVIGTQIWLLLVRGDHDLNEIKAGKVAGLAGFRFATEAEILAHFGTPPGYLGPIGMTGPVKVVADRTVANMSDFVCGANQVDQHYVGVNWDRDILPALNAAGETLVVADLRNVRAGDPSPDGKGVLALQRGIEVGHVFYLGTKYSTALDANFIDSDGRSRPLEMGCYGIGVTRLMGAAIEQNHDDKGIIWPRPIAPFDLVICPLGYAKSEAVRSAADALYAELNAAGVDVILDDRDERPGAMFADWELIGVPLRVTIGDRSLKAGQFEVVERRGLVAGTVPIEGAAAVLRERLAAL